MPYELMAVPYWSVSTPAGLVLLDADAAAAVGDCRYWSVAFCACAFCNKVCCAARLAFHSLRSILSARFWPEVRACAYLFSHARSHLASLWPRTRSSISSKLPRRTQSPRRPSAPALLLLRCFDFDLRWRHPPERECDEEEREEEEEERDRERERNEEERDRDRERLSCFLPWRREWRRARDEDRDRDRERDRDESREENPDESDPDSELESLLDREWVRRLPARTAWGDPTPPSESLSSELSVELNRLMLICLRCCASRNKCASSSDARGCAEALGSSPDPACVSVELCLALRSLRSRSSRTAARAAFSARRAARRREDDVDRERERERDERRCPEPFGCMDASRVSGLSQPPRCADCARPVRVLEGSIPSARRSAGVRTARAWRAFGESNCPPRCCEVDRREALRCAATELPQGACTGLLGEGERCRSA